MVYPTEQRLRDLGFIYPTMLGLQPDLNAAWLKRGDNSWQEASFCDHNCVRGDGLLPTDANGGYDCFAAVDHNRGIIPTSMADFQQLRKWIDIAVQGQKLAAMDFITHDFARYCDDHLIPPEVSDIYARAIVTSQHEINLFGGNPELNDAWYDLIPYLKSEGHKVNLTTTGGRFLREPGQLDMLRWYSPDMLAVSADDLTVDEVKHYAKMPEVELRATHAAISRKRGQDRKALEGLWIAQYASAYRDNFPPVLFNTVIHERNVFEATEMIDALREAFPTALVNPYLAQSSMYNAPPVFKDEHLDTVRWIIQHAIDDTLNGKRVPKRLPFYLALMSVFRTFEPSNRHVIPEYLSGYHMWRCYRPNACWYLQFGRSEQQFVQIENLTRKGKSPSHAPGGHLGCTWNAKTITQSRQIENVLQVRLQIRNIHRAVSANPDCQGCNMPRLMFHAISVENGLDPVLWPAYHELRKEYVGF